MEGCKKFNDESIINEIIQEFFKKEPVKNNVANNNTNNTIYEYKYPCKFMVLLLRIVKASDGAITLKELNDYNLDKFIFMYNSIIEYIA